MRRSSFTSFQFAPASSDMKMPPSFASMIAKRRLLSAPDTAIAALPQIGFGSPALFDSSVHVDPPSVLLNSPLPGRALESQYGVRKTSRNVALTTSGFFGSLTRPTAPVRSLLESTFSHV